MIGSFRLPVSLTSSGDTTAPTILTATVEDANPDKLVVVFSEVVTIANTTGLTITGAATPTLSAPTGSGSNTITFTLSTALTNGQSVTLNIASSNTIKDAANNALAATTKAITNNVAAAATYDPDYQDVLDAASAGGETLPSQAQQDIDNQIMIDYKATGKYASRSMMLKASGTATPGFKLYCWKRKIKMVAYGGLTWDDIGVLPNGVNGYIDPLLDLTNSTTYLSGDAGYDAVIKSTIAFGNGVLFGYFDGSIDGYINLLLKNGVDTQASLHELVKPPEWGVIGYNAVNRDGDVVNVNNGFYTVSKPTTTKTVSPLIFARKRADEGGVDNYFGSKVSFASIGSSVLDKYTELKTLLESI